MRVLILTQNERIVLPKYIGYFLKNIPQEVEIVGAVIFPASPFGKKESELEKILKVFKVFGLGFFLNYGWKFFISILTNRSVVNEIKKNNINIIETEGSINSQTNLSKLKAFKPDLLISLTANQIFKRKLIDLAPKGCLNLHSALLPLNRGLFPTFWALKNGEQKTGVSVFYVDEGIDSGPILVQKEVLIKKRNLNWLIKECKKVGMDAVIEALHKILSNEAETMENDHEKSTYNSFPDSNDVKEFLNNGNKLY
jgi:methionyl-tRNA formyltransferase